MGGRKSARVERIVGKSKELTINKKDFVKSIKTEKPGKIAKSALSFISASNTAIKNLAKGIDFFDYIDKEEKKKPLNYQERKELTSKAWSKLKKSEKIDTPSEVDRILIDSATKVIRRKKK